MLSTIDHKGFAYHSYDTLYLAIGAAIPNCDLIALDAQTQAHILKFPFPLRSVI